jgi:phage baseplate assembly protein W
MAKAFAVEDGNPSVSTILGTRSVEYKDIDLVFLNKTVSGEIYKKTASSAVKQAVKNLVMTNFAEKPFHPTFGGNIRGLLFDLADEDAEEDIENNIIYAINRFEPRAKILNVMATANPDRNAIDVTITFQVVNTQEEVSLSIVLARLR